MDGHESARRCTLDVDHIRAGLGAHLCFIINTTKIEVSLQTSTKLLLCLTRPGTHSLVRVDANSLAA